MKRRIFQLVLLLLLGAMINTMIACGLVIWSDDGHTVKVPLSPIETHSLHVQLSGIGIAPSFDDPDYRFVVSGTRRSVFGITSFDLLRHELELSNRKPTQVDNNEPKRA